MKDLKTKNYWLAWGSGQGRGTFIIIRKSDNKTTLRETGSEGLERYKILARTYRMSKALFDIACSNYEYLP